MENSQEFSDSDIDVELPEADLSTLREFFISRMCARSAVEMLNRFERTGLIEFINQAIELAEKAVETTQVDHPDRPMYLNNLGVALLKRFERTGSKDDLDSAITIGGQVVESTPSDGMYLNNLGNALQRRFECFGSIDDINRAIMTREQAVGLTPDRCLDRSMYLNNLGAALLKRFEWTGLTDDLDRAIVANKQALESNLISPYHTMYLSNLGNALATRAERMGSMDDVDDAIVTMKKAIEGTPEDHPDLSARLSSLGSALQTRFQWVGLMDDLNQAILILERAVTSSPDDHPDRPMFLANLDMALLSRFERTGLMHDLDHAIKAIEKAVESTPHDHSNYPVMLNSLGIALCRRFERTGSTEDLDRAILKNEKAVGLTRSNHHSRTKYLTNLGISLQKRFEQTGSTEDIDRAIIAKEEAVAWETRFDRTGSMNDLDRAISTSELAVQLTSDLHPRYAEYLNNLGIALQKRFERTGSTDDLDRALAASERAVASTPSDHSNRALLLNNFGIALQKRFELTGSMQLLDLAIANREIAVELTPDDHPNRALCLDNLAIVLQRRFELTGSSGDLDRSVVAREQALQSDIAAPSIRLRAASSCSDLLIREGSYTRAKLILQVAVQLLPRVSPRQLRRADQQFNISQFAHITSRAVSLSLADADDPYTSLRFLELGKGIMANLQLEVRSDISVLAASHPDLAQQFQALRDQLDSPSSTLGLSEIEDSSSSSDSTSVVDWSKLIQERRELIKRFDDTLHIIRSLKGFENFLLGPSESELHSLAEEGPIVVFNTSEIRSDAFLITPDQIRVVHLPLLTPASLRDATDRFITAINDLGKLSRYNYARCEMSSILVWLWEVAIKKILNELGFTQMPRAGEVWPRVRWVGSGLLNLFPVHAAGYHDSTPPETALDRVISSYVPTIKSLSYARERLIRSEQIASTEKAIFVAMPKTPDKAPLKNVIKEVEELKTLLSEASVGFDIMQNSTRKEILSELPKHTIVHFACHGYSGRDPSQSSLLLEDWKSAPLTVSDIASLNIELAKFAYLSACHTSATRDNSLLDESISLTSAIQLSGYPSVIGTLWGVADDHAVEIARDVYKWSLRNGKFDVRRSAEGLHEAVRALRDKKQLFSQFRNDPLIWAPFVYIGI